jgi:hypothetical protein
MSEKTVEILSAVCFVLLLIAALMVAQQRDELKQQAVDRGFAEWRIIEGSKETEFKWKGEE